MKRVLLLLAWLLVVAGLYGGLVALEYYWNFSDWQPRADLLGWTLVAWDLAMILVVWLLAGASTDRLTQPVSLLLCLALLALGIYTLAPEPKTPGFLGRQVPSPLWYRAGRLILLSIPSLFWVCRRTRADSGAEK